MSSASGNYWLIVHLGSGFPEPSGAIYSYAFWDLPAFPINIFYRRLRKMNKNVSNHKIEEFDFDYYYTKIM